MDYELCTMDYNIIRYMKAIKKIIFLFKAIFSRQSGLVPACIEMQRAMREARAKNRRTGHRYYCIWDPENRRLVPLTYDRYPGQADSFAYLRQRGKFSPLTRQQFKDGAFFYTASRNGAHEMTEADIRTRLEVLRRHYYKS